MTTEIPLVIENLSFRYQRRHQAALEGISLTLAAGEILLVVFHHSNNGLI